MHKKFYDLPYDSIKQYLLTADKKMLEELLQDPIIKEKLINSPTRHDFIWLAQEARNETIPLLLKGNGVEILDQTSERDDKLNGILTSGNEYVNQLFKNDDFDKLILKYINNLTHYFPSLQEEGALAFYDYLKRNKTKTEQIQTFLFSLSENTQLKLIQKRVLPNEIVQQFIYGGKGKAVEELLHLDLRITTLSSLSFSQLFSLFSKGISIPHQLLEEKALIRKIASIEDPKDYRFLIQELAKANDTSLLEQARKKHYENEFATFNKEENMLARYAKCYQEICSQMEQKSFSFEAFDQTMKNNFHFFRMDEQEFYYRNQLYHYLEEKNKEGLKAFLQQESNLQLTNMIIDYHFEDIYFNFLIDTKQLYQFQQTEGRTLSEEEIATYKKLLQLDHLSYNEKMKLHQSLKQENQVEKYYNDFRKAKDKAFHLIEQEMLTEEKLQKSKDEDISKQLGVNVYVLSGEPFYAFVKSLNIDKSTICTKDNLHSYVEGGSYSLDSGKKLDTYRNPKEYYNILYGDIPTNQIVHMYPVDSFSKYIRDINHDTSRVFELYTPEQFVTKSPDYDEILMAQKKENQHKDDELNSQLKLPTPLAIYCYDSIYETDIESAKETGLDIVVVLTKCYSREQNENQITINDTTGSVDGYKKGLNYIQNISQDAMHGRRK